MQGAHAAPRKAQCPLLPQDADVEKGASTNERRAQRRRSHEEEMSEAKALEISLSKPFREARVFPENTGDTLAILWRPPAGRSSPDEAQQEADERRELEDRYRVEDAGHTRNYWHGSELAFIERLRTIQIVSQKRRVRIDALKLARRRFKRLRIASAQKVRNTLARIAAELGISLEKGPLKKIGHTHAIALEAGSIRSIVAACRAYHDTLDERPRRSAAIARVSARRTHREYGEPDHPVRIETLVTEHVRTQNANLDPMRPILRSKRGADLRRDRSQRFTWHRRDIRRPSQDADTGSLTIPFFFALSRTRRTDWSIRQYSAILQRSRQSSWNAGDGSQPPSFQELHRSKRTIWLSQVRTDRGHPRSGAPSVATPHSAA